MVKEVVLADGERLDDLLTHQLHIIQSREVFSFSMDAVLLARFAAVPPRGKILDLCSGNGVIPLLLTTRTKATIDAVEIQPRLADMARRSIAANGLEDRITVYEGDLREFHKKNGHGMYDVVTVNPPYMPAGTGDQNENEHFAMARHERNGTLDDIVAACAKLVRTGGRVAMVHRPSRLIEIMETMRRWKLEPKRMRFVHPSAEAESNMVLIEAVRDAKPELRMLPPLIVYNEQRQYNEELMRIYYGDHAVDAAAKETGK
ncbi:tRNA1(Val) (adenine(37)-N6)-methyltransferase [Paenibacillus rhizovicinus]|uniref:tRNA1(Val) (Adenine(37)-N6)-methyltransferase n=1 Tax=Paenibacillus rhizovicinus TaxID=2704463 RepID=A0A6C0P2W7_9BACL|nr:tRNA1(Val) (adenine(37)-N6)-methyltransferase [Paenibacillus rhizovicinus]QHW32173.1 tRNA1(Val) (adenine(37)-N6)-methyltransferase [Paenibacillus rhizovicinus]